MPAARQEPHFITSLHSTPIAAPGASADALIDPDTPADACTKQVPGVASALQLVFSDEFNAPGRNLAAAGNDSRWTAVDLWYLPTDDQEVYKPDAVTTRGVLSAACFQSIGVPAAMRTGGDVGCA